MSAIKREIFDGSCPVADVVAWTAESDRGFDVGIYPREARGHLAVTWYMSAAEARQLAATLTAAADASDGGPRDSVERETEGGS